MDRFDHAGIRTAPAQVAVHGPANLFDGWLGVLGKQLRPFDDLTVVAVAALHGLFIDHGLLQRMELRSARELFLLSIPGGQALERRHGFAGDGGEGCHARPYLDSVQEHRARAALRQPAPESRSLQSELVREDVRRGVSGAASTFSTR